MKEFDPMYHDKKKLRMLYPLIVCALRQVIDGDLDEEMLNLLKVLGYLNENGLFAPLTIMEEAFPRDPPNELLH